MKTDREMALAIRTVSECLSECEKLGIKDPALVMGAILFIVGKSLCEIEGHERFNLLVTKINAVHDSPFNHLTN